MSPPNTLKDLRVSAGLTQQELAKKTHVTTQVVLRVEQHIPSSAPLSILDFFSHMASLTPTELGKVYEKERAQKIQEFFDRLPNMTDRVNLAHRAVEHALDHFTTTGTISRGPLHPFTLFRKYYFGYLDLPVSQIKFCQFTGFHPATLSSFERGKIPFKNIGGLLEIIHKLGLFGSYQEQLELACDKYFLTATV